MFTTLFTAALVIVTWWLFPVEGKKDLSIPKNFRVEFVSDDRVNITWNPPDDLDAIDNYRLRYNSSWENVKVLIPKTSTSYQPPKLYPNTTYSFSLSSMGGQVENATTSVVQITTDVDSSDQMSTLGDIAFYSLIGSAGVIILITAVVTVMCIRNHMHRGKVSISGIKGVFYGKTCNSVVKSNRENDVEPVVDEVSDKPPVYEDMEPPLNSEGTVARRDVVSVYSGYLHPTWQCTESFIRTEHDYMQPGADRKSPGVSLEPELYVNMTKDEKSLEATPAAIESSTTDDKKESDPEMMTNVFQILPMEFQSRNRSLGHSRIDARVRAVSEASLDSVEYENDRSHAMSTMEISFCIKTKPFIPVCRSQTFR